MAEYIEREAALMKLMQDGCSAKNLQSISDIPSADVAGVRHGEWKYAPNGMDWGLGAWVCSACGCKNGNLGISERINPYLFSGSKFCPNCGAKMDGGTENG